MGIFDKAKEMLGQNSDKVDQAIDKAGDLIDEKTGNKHAANVDKGQALAKEKLAGFVGGDKLDAGDTEQAPVPPVPGSAAPVTPPTTPSANTPPPATPPV